MQYITAAEASMKWGVSPRQVQRMLADKRIRGAIKHGRVWLIPGNAEKPVDLRKECNKNMPAPLSGTAALFAATAVPMPADNPDLILDTLHEERLCLLYAAELAYLRGDFVQTLHCYSRTEHDDAARLRICPAAIAAAISLGDYRTYTGIDMFLKNCIQGGRGEDIRAAAELALATAAVSVIAPGMAPEWLKAGELSALPPGTIPNALYLRAKYFNCLGRFEVMLAIAQTAISLCAARQGITPYDIYQRLMCAVACNGLERREHARRWLLEAMRLALPHGFITPFSEIVTSLGGLVEQCLEKEFPGYYHAVMEQWQRTWKNWITFHNQFTKDNITLILTLREYHIAVLAAHRIPYAKIARQHCISVGRLKNIMLDIYGKLLISGRKELAKRIL